MATHTPSTTLSRRTALLGGASLFALAGAAYPAENPDAELLRLARQLDALEVALLELNKTRHQLWEVWQQHQDMPTKIDEMVALRLWWRNGDKTEISEIRARQNRLGKETGHNPSMRRPTHGEPTGTTPHACSP
jgi:hypothetical protein